MMLAQVKLNPATRDAEEQRQIRLEAMFEIDLEAEIVQIELARLGDIEHAQGRDHAGEYDGHGQP